MPNAAFYKTPIWRSLRTQRLILDGYRCTVPGCNAPAKVVDHRISRPDVPYLTDLDRIDNLRSLCRKHDNQTKEQPGKKTRGNGGKHTVDGVDATGMPLDPNHPWHKGR